VTRRGTLAYYLAAWVVGCFIVALVYVLAIGPFAPSALLLTYFFVMIAGVVGMLGSRSCFAWSRTWRERTTYGLGAGRRRALFRPDIHGAWFRRICRRMAIGAASNNRHYDFRGAAAIANRASASAIDGAATGAVSA